MKWFLTHYHPRFPRSLVYMLQASEYQLPEYFAWYHRVVDFRAVEKRKRLEMTTKAQILLVLGWVFIIAALLLGMGLVVYGKTEAGIAVIVLAPLVLAYGIGVLLIALQYAIQKPLERKAIAEAKKILGGHPAIKIAIAGSFGKTTMREILKMVISESKRTAAAPHNYNTPLGVAKFVKTLAGDEEVLIFELGEYYPGDVRKLCEIIKPDIGVITGVNEAHLEKFKTVEAAAGTIFELADFLGSKPVYVNEESGPACKEARPEHILYSREGVGDLKIVDTRSDLSGTSFALVRKEGMVNLHSNLLGLHQIGPLAAAAEIAFNLGLSSQQVEQGIARTRSFAHRMNPSTTDGVVTIDDSYNGNPDGVKAVIEFLALLKSHRRFYVTPGLVEMGVKTAEVHRAIGKKLAEAGIEKVVLIKNSVTPYIAEGLSASGYKGEVIWYAYGPSAFDALPRMTVAGDVVLIQNDWPDQYA